MKRTGGAANAEFVAAEWDRVHLQDRAAFDRLNSPPKSEVDVANKERVRRNLAASRELVCEIRDKLSIPIQTVGDLGNVNLMYPDVVPILLEHLEKEYPDDVRFSILQALSAPYGDTVFRAVRIFTEEHVDQFSSSLLYQCGIALAANATKRDVDALLAIIDNESLKEARLPLMRLAAKYKDERVENVLKELLHRDAHKWYVINALKSGKMWSASNAVEPFTRSDDDAIRSEARAFMKAMAKHEGACQT